MGPGQPKCREQTRPMANESFCPTRVRPRRLQRASAHVWPLQGRRMENPSIRGTARGGAESGARLTRVSRPRWQMGADAPRGGKGRRKSHQVLRAPGCPGGGAPLAVLLLDRARGKGVAAALSLSGFRGGCLAWIRLFGASESGLEAAGGIRPRSPHM